MTEPTSHDGSTAGQARRAEPTTDGERGSPVVLLGNPRSGTTALAKALSTCGQFGSFYEGNAWHGLLSGLADLREAQLSDPAMVFEGDRTLSSGRLQVLVSRFAELLDSFHRRHLSGPRWLDKTVEVRATKVVPMMAQMFPSMRFVFLARNGVDSCESNFVKFPWVRETPARTFSIWATFMRRWRTETSLLLGARGTTVRQGDMCARAKDTVRHLREFLDEPTLGKAAVNVLARQRVHSSFAGRAPGDFGYDVDWSEEERTLFAKICGEEMSWWGYSMRGMGIDNPLRSEVEILEDRRVNAERLLAAERERTARLEQLLAEFGEQHGKLREYVETLERANLWLQRRVEPQSPASDSGEPD